MRVALLIAALSCSCVDGHGTAPADLATTADDGSAPEKLACAQSLADYCAQHVCVRDLTTAETSTGWCQDMGVALFAYYATCDEYVLVYASGIDSGSVYAYDAATGELQAVLWYANVNGGCLAGPPEFEFQGCRGRSPICQRL
jgi:hypothetical protein